MSKHKRKYHAIENIEQGIRGYMFLNALMDTVADEDHPHAKVARFIAKATLNELLWGYMEKNSEEQLNKFIGSLNAEAEGAAADVETEPTNT